MSELRQTKCEPCRSDSPPASPNQITRWLGELSGWIVEDVDGQPQLCKLYRFKDFGSAMAFASKAGQAADENDHHPKITIEWGKAEVRWWTHAIRGLHQNDFVMAAICDDLYEG
ncbi:MAG: 4a-hydroxytetrahydrobiopterin dehydratase [Armatimonadetes bacterium]|nr:4a-hydroxytetrahydrobiopterin dehydratase [Armatimonadota bacterium]